MNYVLIPGAGGDSWYWHLVAPRLREQGHRVVTPDLPTPDPEAGLQDYADAVTEAAGDWERVTVVAQSMGAYSASMAELDAERFILVAPMIPAPGETPGEWWERSGQTAAGAPPFDPVETFLHDLPSDVLQAALERGERRQSDRPFADPWPLAAWPDVPTRVIAARHDRLFPYRFMTALARERLGVEAETIDAGHLPALGRAEQLTAML